MSTSKISTITILIIVALAAIGWWLGKNVNSNTAEVVIQESRVKEFNRTISGFTYNPDSIDVNLGDRVIINITNNDDVTHGINLPAFGVSEFVEPGAVKRVEFLANKTGSPELFCSSDHGEKLLINVNG